MALTKAQASKKNYGYGKLIDGKLEYAPYYLVIGNRCYVNPTKERYLGEGWKKIVFAELPEDASEEVEYREVYSEDDEFIYSDWVKVQKEEN